MPDADIADTDVSHGPRTEHLDLDEELCALLVTTEGRADPYPRYARLRERAPVFRSSLGTWVVTRFAQCQQVLRVPHFVKGDDDRVEVRLTRQGVPADEAAAYAATLGHSPSMLTLDPPDHTRLRGLVSRAFTPTTVETLRPATVALCDELLDAMAELGARGATVDVMTALAFPFPVTVIGELLGVPVADRAGFQDLVRTATAALEPTAQLEELRAARGAREEMERYFEALVEERRRRPANDLISELVAASDGDDRLSRDEVVSTAILLFAAGFETTTNLIGNGLLALLRHPVEQEYLRSSCADPTAVQRAVEELLRYDSPVQLDSRVASRPVEIAGTTVAPGEAVMTLIGSANRDPRRFTQADVLDLRRDQGPPLSFGSGIHHCLGAALARMEGQVCFGRLLGRFGSLELRDDTEYRNTITLRGLSHLRLGLGPVRASG